MLLRLVFHMLRDTARISFLVLFVLLYLFDLIKSDQVQIVFVEIIPDNLSRIEGHLFTRIYISN